MDSRLKALSFGLLLGCLGMTVSACNTTKATLDTTAKFTMSTSPDNLFTEDGLVKESQKATLFAAVTYDNLQQDMARGQGEYLTSFGVLTGVPADGRQEWARTTQGRYIEVFSSDPANVEELLARLRLQ